MSGPITTKDSTPLPPSDPAADMAQDAAQQQQETQQEADTAKEAAKETTQEAEQPPESESGDTETTRRRQLSQRQQSNRPQRGQKSQFQQQQQPNESTQMPREFFGHKINTQRQPQKQQAQRPNQNLQTSDTTASRQEHSQRPIPKRPQAQTYRAILQERHFSSGHLKGSPLQKALQQKALAQQSTTAQQQTRDPGRPLDKAQVMQMFRMRHKVQQREKFRQILKHEAARARLAARSKVQGVKQRAESEHQRKQILLDQPNRLDSAKQKISQRLQNASKVSRFEQVLQKTLEGQKSVPNLPQGTRARFNLKSSSEWTQFFKNAFSRGSAEQSTKGELTKLIEALYRGTFQKSGQSQKMLIADFALTHDGEVFENKFSQVKLNNPKLQAALEKLNPGDIIPQELMEQLGKEFEFLKLAHLVQSAAVTEEQQKELLKLFKQQHSSEAQRKMEKALVDQRPNHSSKNKDDKKTPFVWAGDQFDKKQRFDGPPKFFMYILYSLVGVALMFAIYFIVKGVF